MRLQGLEGLTFNDSLTKSLSLETRNELDIGAEVDRVYLHVPDQLILTTGPDSPKISITKSDTFSDVVFWNPWIEKAKAMADFGDEEVCLVFFIDKKYQKMVCVEAGAVSKDVVLEPGCSWTGSQVLRVLD